MHRFTNISRFIRTATVKFVRAIAMLLIIFFATILGASLSLAYDEQDSYLPLKIGSGWELEDDMGRFQIEVKEKEVINNEDYYRIDWTDDMLGGRYQSEYWLNKKDGIYVAGRYFFGKVLMFEKPYLLLKHRLTIGEKWKGQIKYLSFSDTLEFYVEKKEVIKTGIGDFEAIKVVLTGSGLRVIRWYSRGVGIVKETTFKKEKNDFVLLNDKVLAQRIISQAQRNQGKDRLVFTDQDLQKYKSPNTRLEQIQQKESDKTSSLNAPVKDVDYESMLAGTWSTKDENHENVFTLSSNGNFHGVVKKQDTITWTYSGNWSVSGDRLIWVYQENTPQRRPPGSKDIDEIVTVDDDEFIIQEGKGSMLNQFFRVK